MNAVVPTLIITVLILLNGLFVAAEFAIVGAPRPALAQLAAKGHRGARRVLQIVSDAREQDRFIATAQLGITLASLGLGMYGEHLLAVWFAGLFESLGASRWIAAHTLGSILAIAILTYFHIVVGEMVPKSIALQQAERTVLWITPVMRVIQTVTYPLVVLLNGIGNGVLRLLGIERDAAHAEQHRTPKELAYLVHEAQEGGLLRGESARVTSELLDFGELTASEVMVPRVKLVAISLGSTADEVRRLLRERPFTRYPVMEDTIDEIVGMLHVKDMLHCLPTCGVIGVEHIRPLPFVPSTATVDQVMQVMREASSQMAVVLDEHGGTAGILTSEDLFEEIVGDIGDDAAGVGEIRRNADGSVTAAGVARLEALGDALGVDLVHEEVDSVSGLVLAELGRPPRAGDVVRYASVELVVSSVAGRGVREAVARRVVL